MGRPGLVYGLIVAIGLGLTAAAGWVATRAYNQVALDREQAQLESATFAVRVALDRLAIVVRAIRGAYPSGAVDRTDFDLFIRTLTTDENFRSVAFLRRVPESERVQYEAQMVTPVGLPQGIWERDLSGNPVRSPDRPMHYVVEAAYLSDGNRPSLGFDVGALPGRVEAIETAIRDRQIYAQGPMSIGTPPEQGLLLYAPAIDRRGNITGAVLGTLSIESLLELAQQVSGVRQITFGAGPAQPNGGAQLAQSSFDFGQRQWTVGIVRETEIEGSPVPWPTVLVIGAGLASTLAFLGFAAAVFQNARLAEARANLRSMLDGLGPLAWLLGSDGTVIAANQAASKALGLSQEEMIGRQFWAMAKVATDDQRINQLRRAVATARSSSGVRFDVPIEAGDQERVFDLWIQPLGSPADKASSLVVSAVDVTDRHQAQQTQQLLTRELDHRMKNALQVIQAVIRRTALTQSSVSTFEASLSGRIRAMARAHELLASERWLGAEIATILREEISALDAAGQIKMGGPALRINPKAALSFALAMHELGTNALKYGALSVSEGKIDLTWSIDRSGPEPQFVLTWSEHGGPRVEEPKQRGFGSTLIERSIAYELDGKTTVAYRPEGLLCVFSVPLTAIRPFAGNWERPEAAIG